MNKLIEQLKRHEGLRLKPYKCSAGKLTLGFGRNIENVGITEDEAVVLLLGDIDRVRKHLAIYDFYNSNTLSDIRADVLDNMAFNIGVSGLLKFKKMIAAIEECMWDRAANEMLNSKWAKQVPNRAKELAEQMRTGGYK